MNGKRFPLWLFVILVAFTLLVPTAARQAFGQPGVVAALDPIQGLIQVRGADAPEDAWNTITRVHLIAEGEWVRTDHVGMADVTFFEGNQTTILPNTQVRVAKFDFVDDDSPVVTMEQSVGDMVHQINQALDAQSQYEVHTPSAVITVRGTEFWSNSSPQSTTSMKLYSGILEVKGVQPDGTITSPVFISAGQSLMISEIGVPAVPTEGVVPPPFPPDAPLAPATCGNGVCEADEQQNGTCVLDCQTFPGCGDGQCDLEGLEGPVTCPADCVPEMRLDTEPPVANGNTGGVQPTGQPCTISAATYVDLRVGPGYSRGVRGSLPLNVNIPVIGKYVDAQGLVWWKIQPPGFIQAEADRYWVLDTDVTETGDCALVPDAPPSGVVAPPPPPQPTAPPEATVAPGVTPVTPVSISFYADRYTVDVYKKECATLFWDVEGIDRVYLDGRGVTGHGSRQVCPTDTTTYTLLVYLRDGSTTTRTVTINVVYLEY